MQCSDSIGPHRLTATGLVPVQPSNVGSIMLREAFGGCAVRTVTVAVASSRVKDEKHGVLGDPTGTHRPRLS